MAKKGQRGSDDGEEESQDIFLSLGPKCPHINKAANRAKLRRAVTDGQLDDLTQCTSCLKESNGKEKEVEVEKDKEKTAENVEANELPEEVEASYNAIWVCLQCGHRGCSRYSKNQHSLKHTQIPTSDSHDIAVNCLTWQVWCYKCDDYIDVKQKSVLEKLVEQIRNIKESAPKKINNIKNLYKLLDTNEAKASEVAKKKEETKSESPEPAPSVLEAKVKVTTIRTPIEELKRPKGLQNLGNTCFFNSVMQNLAQSHLLADACIAACQPDCNIELKPIGSASLVKDMDTLKLKLSEPSVMTVALCEFFREFRHGSKAVFSPGSLFAQIAAKSPQFRGFQQQDSHELLRHLFEGVFNEESRRMKSAVLQNFGLKSSTPPNSVKEHIKKQIDAYKKHTNHTFLESVFGGLLVNTILCLECRKSSQTFEPFVDLSLPIVAAKPFVPSKEYKTEVNSDEEKAAFTKKEGGPSKHQLKKSKQQKRRDAKRKRKTSLRLDDLAAHLAPELTNGTAVSNGEIPEAEVAQEAVEESPSTKESSPETEQDIEDSGHESENETSDGKNDENVDSLLTLFRNDLTIKTRRSPEGTEVNDSGVDVVCPNLEENALIQENKELWKKQTLSTLASRELDTPIGDYSLTSCLMSFTAEELLTGKNKFGCDHCTEEKGKTIKGKDGKDKKERVYTDARMQLLVLIPPAILTMHFKRFMQDGFRLKKNGVSVSYPKILDFAPFCSKACVNLPQMRASQKKILYSLYGVVEHSGSLHGGHYTAYVKVRPNTRHGEKFLNKLPLKMELDELVREMHRRCDENETNQDATMNGNEAGAIINDDEEVSLPEGRWYYISDSHVSEATETSALNSQAYLLFYERLT